MKVHQVVLTIIDFDDIGPEAICETLADASYPNDCIRPSIRSLKSADIGVWDDDHPLNRSDTSKRELERLFGVA